VQGALSSEVLSGKNAAASVFEAELAFFLFFVASDK